MTVFHMEIILRTSSHIGEDSRYVLSVEGLMEKRLGWYKANLVNIQLPSSCGDEETQGGEETSPFLEPSHHS